MLLVKFKTNRCDLEPNRKGKSPLNLAIHIGTCSFSRVRFNGNLRIERWSIRERERERKWYYKVKRIKTRRLCWLGQHGPYVRQRYNFEIFLRITYWWKQRKRNNLTSLVSSGGRNSQVLSNVYYHSDSQASCHGSTNTQNYTKCIFQDISTFS